MLLFILKMNQLKMNQTVQGFYSSGLKCRSLISLTSIALFVFYHFKLNIQIANLSNLQLNLRRWATLQIPHDCY